MKLADSFRKCFERRSRELIVSCNLHLLGFELRVIGFELLIRRKRMGHSTIHSSRFRCTRHSRIFVGVHSAAPGHIGWRMRRHTWTYRCWCMRRRVQPHCWWCMWYRAQRYSCINVGIRSGAPGRIAVDVYGTPSGSIVVGVRGVASGPIVTGVLQVFLGLIHTLCQCGYAGRRQGSRIGDRC